jgi:hypothetical protein
LLARVKQDVVQAFNEDEVYTFMPSWVLIATWRNVTFAGALFTNKVWRFNFLLRISLCEKLLIFSLTNHVIRNALY